MPNLVLKKKSTIYLTFFYYILLKNSILFNDNSN
jgi:hypothetical protein